MGVSLIELAQEMAKMTAEDCISRQGEPEFHKEVRQLTKEIMILEAKNDRRIERYIEEMIQTVMDKIREIYPDEEKQEEAIKVASESLSSADHFLLMKSFYETKRVAEHYAREYDIRTGSNISRPL